MEPVFNEFMEHLYQVRPPPSALGLHRFMLAFWIHQRQYICQYICHVHQACSLG